MEDVYCDGTTTGRKHAITLVVVPMLKRREKYDI